MKTIFSIGKLAVLGLLAALILALAGCGGSGSSNGGGASSTPKFSGFYQGTVTPKPSAKAPATRAQAPSSSFTFNLQMNNAGGTANFTQANPFLNFTASINNVYYNAGTKELSFKMSNFSAVYTSANFTGSVTTDVNNQITALNGTFSAVNVSGATVTGSFGITFKVGVGQANFSGDWSGQITVTPILSLSGGSTYNWSGTWTQTNGTVSGTISYVDGSGNKQTFTFPGGPSGQGAVTGNVMTVQAQAPFTYGGQTLSGDGSVQATLTDANTMTGQFSLSTVILHVSEPVATGTFTATKPTVVNTNSSVQFANYTVQTTSPLLAKIGSTGLGTNYVQAGQLSSTAQVATGTSNFTLTPQGSSSPIINTNASFDGTFRTLFVGLDDTLSGGTSGKPVVQAFEVNYPNNSTLPSGDVGLTIIEGVDTSANGFGTNVDFYVYPASGQMPAKPTATNLAYGQAAQLKLATGSYIIAATATGTTYPLATSSALSLPTNGQYYVTGVVSPPNLSAIFETPAKLFQ